MRVEFKSADGSVIESAISANPAFAIPFPSPPAPPRARGTGARLVAELVALAGGHGTLIEHRQSAWASVTFSGTRHELAFRYDGMAEMAGGETLIAALSDHEFTIPRQLVADAAVVEVSHKMLPDPLLDVRCEVLLLDEN